MDIHACTLLHHISGALIQSHLSFAKKNSLKQVACHKYKADIAQISTQLSGAEPGQQGYIAMFQATVNKFMDILDDDENARLEEI